MLGSALAPRLAAPCSAPGASSRQAPRSSPTWAWRRQAAAPHRPAAAAAQRSPQEAVEEGEEEFSGATAPDQLEVTSEQQPSSSGGSSSSSAGGEDDADESREFALAMARIAWETKAEDIQVLHVAPVVYWTRFMLIATVYSRPQLNAILGKIVKEAADVHGRRLALSPTGTSGGWELCDYGDVVLHIMTADQREYYALEDFYGAADEVPLPFDQSEAAGPDNWTKKM